MPLPKNIAFCSFALDGPHLAVEDATVQIADGLTVSKTTAPIDLDNAWETWLGSIEARKFRDSSFVIAAQWPRAENPLHIEPDVHERLERRVRLFHHALVLKGCAYSDGALMVQGNTYHGLHVGPISTWRSSCHRPEYRRFKRVGIDELREAARMLPSLEDMYARVPLPTFRRLRKGFNSWIRAVESTEVEHRLHAFIRAVEAIIRPTTSTKPRGRRYRPITPTFIERGQCFVGSSSRNRRLLQQLYELRSRVEHLKNILPAVHKPRGIRRAEAFAFRALQAEILASEVYSRILSNDQLRQQLRSEQSVEGFWRRTPAGRAALWGTSIDLNDIARCQFRPTLTDDLL